MGAAIAPTNCRDLPPSLGLVDLTQSTLQWLERPQGRMYSSLIEYQSLIPTTALEGGRLGCRQAGHHYKPHQRHLWACSDESTDTHDLLQITSELITLSQLMDTEFALCM